MASQGEPRCSQSRGGGNSEDAPVVSFLPQDTVCTGGPVQDTLQHGGTLGKESVDAARQPHGPTGTGHEVLKQGKRLGAGQVPPAPGPTRGAQGEQERRMEASGHFPDPKERLHQLSCHHLCQPPSDIPLGDTPKTPSRSWTEGAGWRKPSSPRH